MLTRPREGRTAMVAWVGHSAPDVHHLMSSQAIRGRQSLYSVRVISLNSVGHRGLQFARHASTNMRPNDEPSIKNRQSHVRSMHYHSAFADPICLWRFRRHGLVSHNAYRSRTLQSTKQTTERTSPGGKATHVCQEWRITGLASFAGGYLAGMQGGRHTSCSMATERKRLFLRSTRVWRQMELCQ
jgi:hypothetical protein